jgi:hypothetical protein
MGNCRCSTRPAHLARDANLAVAQRSSITARAQGGARSGGDAQTEVVHDFSRIATHGREWASRPLFSKPLKVSDPSNTSEREADSVTERLFAIKPAASEPAAAPLLRASSVRAGIYNGGDGQPLSAADRAYFEPRFGVDFSTIRVHTDQRAAEASQSLGARAFTVGSDVVFGAGEYSPGSAAARRLLAHELVHAIQQDNFRAPDGPGGSQTRHRQLASQISATGDLGIQRSVQRSGVRSPEEVLAKIRTFTDLYDQMQSPLGELFLLGQDFDPGAGQDSPLNAFVYTCLGGWIDMGHFFNSAALAYLTTPGYALKKGIGIEEGQQRVRERYERATPSEREKEFGAPGKTLSKEQADRLGTAQSAYTIEDLPSDKFGADFGAAIWHAVPLIGKPPPGLIHSKVGEFFRSKHAVTIPEPMLDAVMEETLVDRKNPTGLPRQNRDTSPTFLKSAEPLCPRAPAK